MKKVYSIVEGYFKKNDQNVQRFINKDKLPIFPVEQWNVLDGNKKYIKKYTFNDLGKRNLFMLQVFRYEKMTMHCADIFIKEFEIDFEVYTRGINKITELDEQYIQEIDIIYKDVLNMR